MFLQSDTFDMKFLISTTFPNHTRLQNALSSIKGLGKSTSLQCMGHLCVECTELTAFLAMNESDAQKEWLASLGKFDAIAALAEQQALDCRLCF